MISSYESTYAQEKAKIMVEDIAKTAGKYHDVQYIEDREAGSDKFLVYNKNLNEFKECIKGIDQMYNFPKDTTYSFSATLLDENSLFFRTLSYDYSSGKSKLDVSEIR